jgi:ABC-type lipoprotein export system ATPase subunit
VKRLNQEKGITIIMVTHDQRLASEANRTVHMLDGLIVDETVNKP